MRSSALRRVAYSRLSKQAAAFVGVNVANVVLCLMLSQVFLPSFALATLVACASLFVIAAIYFAGRVIYDSWRIRYIAFVSEGTRGVIFYETFFEHLVREAHDHSSKGRYQYVIFPWIAEHGRTKAQLDSLRRINHSGMIVVLTDKVDAIEDLAPHKVPVVLFDSIPRPTNLPYYFSTVGGNESEGGSIAGRSAVDYLQKVYSARPGIAPYILILHGRNFEFMPQHRSKSFSEEVRRFFPNAYIRTSESLYFSRDNARTYVYDQLENLENSNEIKRNTDHEFGTSRLPDLIFAANDDMALGAREALRQLEEEGRLGPLCEEYGFSMFDGIRRTPQIIGYDGIAEMTDLLRSENERYLLATVNTQVENQAKNTWHAIVKQLEGVEERQWPVTMELVKRNWYYEPNAAP